MPDLLYEIGTEELPAGYLEPGLAQLADQLRQRLEDARLAPTDIITAGTPRRMTVAVRGIPDSQPPETTRIVGPPAKVAFDDAGNPTAAAHGFARSKGVSLESLRVEESDKGPYVVAVVEHKGQPAADLLPAILAEATAAVSFPKSMLWESGGFTFARPIRGIVALLDERVLPVRLADVEAGRATQGHPFLSPGPIELADASYDAYRIALREHYVIVDVAERRETIREQIDTIMQAYGTHVEDMRLLEEVTNMVEWPCAVEGVFDDHFLRVPAAVLSAAMKGHQRYFPVRDGDGGLLPRFITVSNRGPEQADLVREGNERVLLARLEDAKFFWEEDKETRLDDLAARLEGVVFLAGLGNNLQRTERLVALAGRIAEMMGPPTSVEHVQRAARLCKADLLTGLVGEFPSLQGIVGCELALAQGEDATVARAMAEHYLPVGADDALPASPEGSALALADKLDVIVGCFSLGLLPSGSQDPYALRRNALGILLIIEKNGLDLHLGDLVQAARDIAAQHDIRCDDEAGAKILDFIRDRLYNTAIDRGARHDFVRAVLARGADDVKGFWDRLAALEECSKRPWWPALVELVDRTYRIQRDVEEIAPLRKELLQEPLEQQLAAALAGCQDEVKELFAGGDYVGAAERYASALSQLVHDFFEEVFVNVDDQAVRLNRKSLCGWVYHLFADAFADLYVIETTGETA